MLTSEWQKSSRSSNQGSCVEARLNNELIEVRNSNDPGGPTLRFNKDEWNAFIPGVLNGEFDL